MVDYYHQTETLTEVWLVLSFRKSVCTGLPSDDPSLEL